MNIKKDLVDIGFRVLKLGSSNFEYVGEYKAPNAYSTDLDIIFEVMLRLGMELTEKIRKMGLDGKTTYCVGEDNLLIICLENDISTELVEKMSSFASSYIVLFEKSFKSLPDMEKIKLLLKDKKINLELI